MLRPAGLAAQRLSHRLQVFRLQTPEGLTKTFLRWKSYKSGPQCLRKGDTPPYPFILSTERRSPGPGHGEAVGFLEEPPHARTRRAGADSESEFNSAQVLSLLYRCAFQAVFPRASDDVPEEFRDLDLLCQRHSVRDVVGSAWSQRCTILLKGNAFGSSGHVSEMPIDSIVTYFGIHTAEYFAFLHEYATWLLLPAVLGVAVQAVLSLGHDGLDEVRGSCSGAWALGAEGLVAGLALVGLGSAQPRRHISQAFMVFMSARSLKEFTGVGLSPKKGPELKVWTTAFIEHWKRCRAGLHYQFGARLEDRQAEAECEAPAAYCIETKRLQLIPSLARAFAAGSRQRAESDHEVAGGAGRSGPGRVRDLSKDKEQGLATLLEVVLSLLSLVDSHFELQTHVSGVVYLLLRLGEVAQQRSDSVVIQNVPVVIYLIVVSLMERLYQKGVSSLVHMEGHVSFAEHLKSLISKTLFFQLVNYLGWFLYVAFCIQDLDYLRSQLLSFMTVKQVVAVAQEVLLPVILQRFRRWQGKGAQASSKEPDMSSAAAPKTRRCASLRRLGTHAVLGDGTSLEKDVGRQLALDKTDLCTEYQQLVVLFALTSSFAAERSDGYKFLMVNMLSAPSATDGVISDTWVEVLEALSIVSVVCNVAVLAVSGSRWTALSLAVLEHALLIFKASAIGTVPGRWPGNLGVPAMAASGAGNVARFSSVPMFSVPKMDSFPAPCLITSDESGSTDITDQDEFAGLDAGTASSTTCEDYPEDEESVELRGLPFSTTLEAGSQVMRDGRPSGLANVHFRTKEASLRAIDALHMQELGGRYIEALCRHKGKKLEEQQLNVRSRISR
ncbi:ANO10 [Symbiodinium sp. KB8]|nr:ANO10 [Symbiodinium sp. KB8]